MVLNIVDNPDDVKKEYDVCIIGSGAGGSVLAHKLSKAGKDIAILEKGGDYRLDWIKNASEEELLKLWKSGGEQLSRNFSVNIAQAECVGGATLINWGVCFNTPEPVLDYWRRIFGFPYSKEEMDEAFKNVTKMLKVQKVKNAGLAHQMVEKGVKALGYHGAWMERNSKDGVKRSTVVSYLDEADEELVRIFPNCEVDRVVTTDGTASGVEGTFTNPKDCVKKNFTMKSKTVILAGGAIASSGLLLKSGMANKNRQVGRHLSIHPGAGVIGEFEEEINNDIHFPMAYYCDEFSVLQTGRPGFIIESTMVPPYQLGLNVMKFGKEHQDIMKKYSHLTMAGVLVHDEPSGSVSLNWSNEPVIYYSLTRYDQKKMINGLEEAARILLAAGAKKVRMPHFKSLELSRHDDIRWIRELGMKPGTLIAVTPHPQGGNRMGCNKSYCVVNEHCEMFDVPNLFVCDASVFPTSVGVNPQVTIMAIADRTAEYIIENTTRYFS